MCLLQELIRIPMANTTAKMITALFMAIGLDPGRVYANIKHILKNKKGLYLPIT
jgi:hypothetical protein